MDDSDSDYNPGEYVEKDGKKGGRGRPLGKKKTPSGIEKVLSSMATQFLPGNKPFLKAFFIDLSIIKPAYKTIF